MTKAKCPLPPVRRWKVRWKWAQSGRPSKIEYYHCGGKHQAPNYWYKEAKCRTCGKIEPHCSGLPEQ